MTGGVATDRPRVLAFVWGGIGNMVMALPMIAALRDDTTLTVVAQTGAMMELVNEDALATAVALDEQRFRGMRGRLRLIRQLRACRADIAISSIPAPRRFELLARLAGARRLIREGPPAGRPRHLARRDLAQLGPVGIVRSEPDYSLLFRGDAAPLLRSLGIAANEQPIGIFMGAGHPMRRWPRDRFAQLASRLAKTHRVLIFNGPDEQEVDVDGGSVRSFSGPLRQKLGLLAACRLFIGANTGLTHAAAALGVPTLELTGPTDPAVYGALGRNVRILNGEADCAPCYRSGNRYRCGERSPDCMNAITVDQVLAAAQTLLAERP